MSRTDPTAPPTESSPNVVSLKLAGWGGVVAAIGLIIIAVLLTGRGSMMNFVQQRRVAAFRALHRTKPPNPKQAINQLSAAADRNPYDANLRAELGQAFLDAAHLRELRNSDNGRRFIAAWIAAPSGDHLEKVIALGAWKNANSADPTFRSSLVKEFLKPGMEQMIAARDLCPLLARPNARLAAYAVDAPGTAGWKMAQSDPSEAYWKRAIELTPYDGDLLYFAGLAALQADKQDSAWPLWKRALERSVLHTGDVVSQALPRRGRGQVASGCASRRSDDSSRGIEELGQQVGPGFRTKEDSRADPRRALRPPRSFAREHVPIGASASDAWRS